MTCIGECNYLKNTRAEIQELRTELAHLKMAEIEAMPKSYQPHNVLGKYLEKKSKFAEALAEYRKSILIEQNRGRLLVTFMPFRLPDNREILVLVVIWLPISPRRRSMG